jgi:hypothetical protein
MIDKGDIPSIQCKMSLRGPKSILDCQESVRVTSRLVVYRQSVRLDDDPLETHDTVILFPN